jgi:acyl-CoA synthetase (AMP-forming)/AMP-acid ligase II
MAIRTLSAALDRIAKRTPLSPALLVPEQGLALSYADLSSSTKAFAAGLSKWGVQRRDVIVSDLPNTAENLSLQLAASRAGAAVATVKDQDALERLVAAVAARGGRVSGCIAASDASFLNEAGSKARLPLPSVCAGKALDALMRGPADEGDERAMEPDSSDAEPVLAFWNSLTPLTHAQALAQGEVCADALSLSADDRVCVAITLCHAFGIGSACAGALLRGAAIVLPAVGGIRGCGVPEERAAVTLRVLAAQHCSVLFADTHTLKAFAAPAMVAAREALDLSRLRAGVIKVGSGADILDETVEFAGVQLRTLGKRAAKK